MSKSKTGKSRRILLKGVLGVAGAWTTGRAALAKDEGGPGMFFIPDEISLAECKKTPQYKVKRIEGYRCDVVVKRDNKPFSFLIEASEYSTQADAEAHCRSSARYRFKNISRRQTFTMCDTVICSELHRQGLIPYSDVRFSYLDAQTRLTDRHMAGYWLWAPTIVRLMRRSPVLTQCWLWLYLQRRNYVRARWREVRSPLMASFVAIFGEGVCYTLGYALKSLAAATKRPAPLGNPEEQGNPEQIMTARHIRLFSVTQRPGRLIYIADRRAYPVFPLS